MELQIIYHKSKFINFFIFSHGHQDLGFYISKSCIIKNFWRNDSHFSYIRPILLKGDIIYFQPLQIQGYEKSGINETTSVDSS